MAFNKRFLMWGVIPVAFNDQGAWVIDVEHPYGKRALNLLAVGLLKVNAGVEWISEGTITLTPPLVPRQHNMSSSKA